MIEKEDKLKFREELKKYLNQKTNYSFNNLKNNLGIESDDDFLILQCDLIKDAINNFNFETPVYYNKYLFKAINYLTEAKSDLLYKDILIKKIEKNKNMISCKINKNKSNTNVAITNKAFLLSINSELNFIISKLKYNTLNKIDDENIDDVYNILHELVFKVRNPIYIEEILDSYPNLINIKHNNRYLYEDILDKYLNILLNRNDDFELLYFNKLVLTYVNLSKKTNEEIKNITIFKVNKLLDSLEKREIDLEKKEKIKFFIKEIKDMYIEQKIKEKDVLNNLKIKYNLKRINQIEKCKLIKPNWKEYKENNQYILTFDDPFAKVLENAISFTCLKNGNYFLGLYVSDVSGYLNNLEKLKNDIYLNALSIKGFPMLPNEFRKELSLIEGKRKRAIAYLFEFDQNLKIINFRVEKQLIKVKHNFKFSDVKNILDYPINTKLREKVLEMYLFSTYILNNENDKDSYHDIKEISKKILYDDEYKQKNIGATMISNYQIFLNSFIPKYCYDRKLPYLYRNNHFNHSVELINQIKEKYKDNLDLQDILSLVYAVYEPSVYSTINMGHAGLNLEAYGEVSKPTRSLASIVNQDLINKYLIDGMILPDKDKKILTNKLNKICEHLNKKRIIYDNYIYERNKVLKKHK